MADIIENGYVFFTEHPNLLDRLERMVGSLTRRGRLSDAASLLNGAGWIHGEERATETSRAYFRRAAELRVQIAEQSEGFDKVLAYQSATMNYALANDEPNADKYLEMMREAKKG